MGINNKTCKLLLIFIQAGKLPADTINRPLRHFQAVPGNGIKERADPVIRHNPFAVQAGGHGPHTQTISYFRTVFCRDLVLSVFACVNTYFGRCCCDVEIQHIARNIFLWLFTDMLQPVLEFPLTELTLYCLPRCRTALMAGCAPFLRSVLTRPLYLLADFPTGSFASSLPSDISAA